MASAGPLASVSTRTASEEKGDMDRLMREIMEDPDKVNDATFVTDEQLAELQRRLNPFGVLAEGVQELAPGKKRLAAVSFMNLRADYLRRFAMTSLVGFVFQMVKEWEVPGELRRWVPAARKKKVKTGDPATVPLEADAILQGGDKLRSMAVYAADAKKEFDTAAAAALKATADARGSEAADGKEPSDATEAAQKAEKEAKEAAAAAEMKFEALRYAYTRELAKMGVDAEGRLDATTARAQRFPELKEMLHQAGVRPDEGSQIEFPPALAKGIIENFITHWFEFDPNVHVRDAAAPLTAAEAPLSDPERLPLEALRAALAVDPEHKAIVAELCRTRDGCAAAQRVLRDPELATALAAVLTPVVGSDWSEHEPVRKEHPQIDDAARNRFRQYIAAIPSASPARPTVEQSPPQDTFHRWNYYTEVNYEELRAATEALYHDKPDLDWALALWDVFEGTPKEVDAAFGALCEKNEDVAPGRITALEFGKWSLLGDFKANRERMSFYNKHTEVIKRIIERHTEDARIGKELMKNRVRQEKAKNIKEVGPDAPGLKNYKKEDGSKLSALGAERVISAAEMRRLNRARGDVKAARELEHLEKLELRQAELDKIEKTRPLTAEEHREVAQLKKDRERAEEMLNVPEGKLQVDVFVHDAKTGDMRKERRYIDADTEEETKSKLAEAARVAGDSKGRGPGPRSAAAP